MFDVQTLLELDRAATIWINQHHNVFLDVVVGGVSMMGDGGVLWVAVPIMFIIWGDRRERMVSAIFIAAVGFTQFVPLQIMQGWWPRERPHVVLDSIRVVGVGWETASFPSGHAHLWVQAAIVFGALYRRFRTPLIIVAILSVYSRPYTGNHWVLDALAGAALGTMMGWLQIYINNRLGLIPGPDEEPEEPTIPWHSDDEDDEQDQSSEGDHSPQAPTDTTPLDVQMEEEARAQ